MAANYCYIEMSMLQLTKSTEYGLIGLVYLADRQGEVVSVREIADAYNLPRRHLGESLKALCRVGLLKSQRGAHGGYRLAQEPEVIALSSVVAALEGKPSLTSGETGRADASDGIVEPNCPIRSPIQRIRQGFWRQMEQTTLRALIDGPHAMAGSPAPIDHLTTFRAGA
jgi:Rrf2 family nitric oxide-sensitive transcriptional repressor